MEEPKFQPFTEITYFSYPIQHTKKLNLAKEELDCSKQYAIPNQQQQIHFFLMKVKVFLIQSCHYVMIISL